MEIGRFSLFSLLSVGLAGIGCLFHVIGLSVVYWIVTDPFKSSFGYGLWKVCFGLLSKCRAMDFAPDYWKATKAFVIIGFLFGAVALILSIVCLIKKVKVLRLLSSIGLLCAAACILLAVIIFGAKTEPLRSSPKFPLKLGWGFILSTVSSFFFIAGGIMGLMDYRGYTGQTVYSHAGVVINTGNAVAGQVPPATFTPGQQLENNYHQERYAPPAYAPRQVSPLQATSGQTLPATSTTGHQLQNSYPPGQLPPEKI